MKLLVIIPMTTIRRKGIDKPEGKRSPIPAIGSGLLEALAAAAPTIPRKVAGIHPPTAVHRTIDFEDAFSGRYRAYSAGKFSQENGIPAMNTISANSQVPAYVFAASGATG